MKYKALKDKHDELEHEVMDALRTEILRSKTESKTVQVMCIPVNVFDYTELAIIHGDLMFLDNDGLHYDVYCECTLEDLIDILAKL